jgi:hypothetical protein
MTTTKTLSFSTVNLRYQAQDLCLEDTSVMPQRSDENHNFNVMTHAEPSNKEGHSKGLPHSHWVEPH